jgi:hypothetical protein
MVAVGVLAGSSVLAATRDLGNGYADHGVATPVSCHRGTVATVDAEGHRVVLSWLMDHRGCYELLLVDVETGAAEEHPISFPLGDSPFASILSRANKYYTHFGSHFIEFDPARREFTFCQKTSPQMAMSMTEDDQGVIWSATYPQSGVVSFNPQTRALRDYGHVYRQDWSEYPRSIAVDDAGWVYLGIGTTACQIVTLDRTTGNATAFLEDDDREHGTAYVFRGEDGKVYGQPLSGPKDNWCEFYQGRATPIGKRPSVAAREYVAGSQGLFHRPFPDGSRIADFDLLERQLTVEETGGKPKKTISFDYQSEGAHIMGVATAPDSTLCGGTAFPMRFFRYDPRKDEWTHHANYGQWNTVARQGDRFFAGAYTHGWLLEWNPFAPWVDTGPGKEGSNPSLLADGYPAINRPHKLLAHPDGRTLVLAGTPAYGLTGGGLLFWDRTTRDRVLRTHEELIPEHSTMSLVAVEGDRLLGGTTTSPGTGGLRKAEQAELYLLDLNTKHIQWHEPVLPGVQDYTDLCLGPNGLVWGFADRRLFFVFDPAARKTVHQQPAPAELGGTASGQGPRVFVRGPNDEVYALFVRGVASIDPGTWQIKLLAPSPVPVASGGDFLDGRIYFTSGSHLYSFQISRNSR